ncbi:nucleoside triphosphate pyrophosphatase [Sporosarcina sp. JAI121]|uniref:Maf family protein n=1 Tax=Sporosarcina sp. JAI121 TaxID=2723064 RepID=UPI0017CE2B09|nr:Maf family protein [Sporosarcina sp. JAI121]NYF25013.1 septum formation protein [Sporosarcina sp. JAI121]
MKFMINKPVILASASPRRKEILNLLGFPFRVVPSNVSEVMDVENGDFKEYARKLAALKTSAVADDEPGSIVIGADTIVVHEGKLYSKPESKEQATAFLKELSGETHTVITGVGLSIDGVIRTFSVETKVTFRQLDDVLIDAYVESGDPMDKAGGYGIQTAGSLLVEKIDGDYYNVMGLPISKLTEHMRRLGLMALKVGDPYIDF